MANVSDRIEEEEGEKENRKENKGNPQTMKSIYADNERSYKKHLSAARPDQPLTKNNNKIEKQKYKKSEMHIIHPRFAPFLLLLLLLLSFYFFALIY